MLADGLRGPKGGQRGGRIRDLQGLSQAGGGLSEQFDALSKDLQRDIETFKKGQFSNWQQSLHDRLSDFRLDKNSKLMDLDTHSGHVKLHYNSQLVELLREVSALRVLSARLVVSYVERLAPGLCVYGFFTSRPWRLYALR